MRCDGAQSFWLCDRMLGRVQRKDAKVGAGRLQGRRCCGGSGRIEAEGNLEAGSCPCLPLTAHARQQAASTTTRLGWAGSWVRLYFAGRCWPVRRGCDAGHEGDREAKAFGAAIANTLRRIEQSPAARSWRRGTRTQRAYDYWSVQ